MSSLDLFLFQKTVHVLCVHPIPFVGSSPSSHSPDLAAAILTQQGADSVSFNDMKDQRVAADGGADHCAGARGIAPFAGIDPLIYVGGEP